MFHLPSTIPCWNRPDTSSLYYLLLIGVQGCVAARVLGTSNEADLIAFRMYPSFLLCHRIPVDVAVIDEIQMIGDPHRGSAWTRAVLGVLAPEVHLCGDPAAEPALRSICKLMGDELEVRRTERAASGPARLQS